MIQKSWNDLTLLTKAEDQCIGRYPPRILFGKGILAEGWFQPYMSLRDDTKAKFLSDPELRTPVMVRFSAATAQPGSGDTARDIRAMAVKLYTKEGNCDLLSLSLPDCPWKTGDDLIDCIRTVKYPGPAGLLDPCGYLTYAVDHPHAMGSILQLYGNRGIPANFSCMESWGMGEMLWENGREERFLVNHHWVPDDPPRYLSENEGEFLCGYDPDYMRRKMIHRLQDGRPAVFELRLELQSANCEEKSGEQPQGEVIRAGRMVLEKIPENQAELEPVFCCSPDTLVSGIALIEGSYLHQLSLILRTLENFRLGSARRTELVNRHWRCPGNAPLPKVAALEIPAPERAKSPIGDGCREEVGDEVRRIWNGFSDEERRIVIKNIAQRLLLAPEHLQKRFLKELEKVEPQIAESIENQLIF
ncbi:MAG: catalase [Firmicutes bacterium]|nr:catalase [Bacillota bacterium]